MKVKNLFALFLLITYARTKELEFFELNSSQNLPRMEKILSLLKGIQASINYLKSERERFKTSDSSIIKRIVELEKFTSFPAENSIFVTKEVKPNSLDKFFNLFRKFAKIPPKYADEMDYLKRNIEFVDGDAWASYNFLFNVKDAAPDTANYASIIGTHNVKYSDNYDFFIVLNTVNFKFVPNIMSIKESLSFNGGIFSSRNLKEVEKPKSVSEEDIKLIMNYFQGNSIMALGKFFGIYF